LTLNGDSRAIRRYRFDLARGVRGPRQTGSAIHDQERNLDAREATHRHDAVAREREVVRQSCGKLHQ